MTLVWRIKFKFTEVSLKCCYIWSKTHFQSYLSPVSWIYVLVVSFKSIYLLFFESAQLDYSLISSNSIFHLELLCLPFQTLSMFKNLINILLVWRSLLELVPSHFSHPYLQCLSLHYMYHLLGDWVNTICSPIWLVIGRLYLACHWLFSNSCHTRACSFLFFSFIHLVLFFYTSL